jgi:hypothetical protein
MTMSSLRRTAAGRGRVGGALAPASVLAVLALAALAPFAAADATTAATPQPKSPASATLEGCVTSAEQAERSATFAGEMTAIAGSAKMEMRIDVLERLPGELEFHLVTAPGLGVWRWAAPGVKTYRYLKQVTNLTAPADYRALVHFRWLSSKGKTLKILQLRTPRCSQTAPAPSEPPANG